MQISMHAAVHEIGPSGDTAMISDGGDASCVHSNILANLSSSFFASVSVSFVSFAPRLDADVVVTTTNIKIASFSKVMFRKFGSIRRVKMKNEMSCGNLCMVVHFFRILILLFVTCLDGK